MDGVYATKRVRQDCRTRPGRRREPLDNQYRDFLRGLVTGRVEFHHHAAQHAHTWYVSDAHAADLLGLVHYRGAGLAVISGAPRWRHSVDAGSHGWHQLLHSERPVR